MKFDHNHRIITLFRENFIYPDHRYRFCYTFFASSLLLFPVWLAWYRPVTLFPPILFGVFATLGAASGPLATTLRWLPQRIERILLPFLVTAAYLLGRFVAETPSTALLLFTVLVILQCLAARINAHGHAILLNSFFLIGAYFVRLHSYSPQAMASLLFCTFSWGGFISSTVLRDWKLPVPTSVPPWSAILYYGIRSVPTATLALSLEHYLDFADGHGWWLSMMFLVINDPDNQRVKQVAYDRVYGAIAGGIAGLALAELAAAIWVYWLVGFMGLTMLFLYQTKNSKRYIACPTFLILLTQSSQLAPFILFERVVDSLVAGGIAILLARHFCSR